MAGCAAVCIDNDLPARQAAVAHRTADDKASGGVNVEFGIAVDVFRGDGRLNHCLHNSFPQVLNGDVGSVLGGHHNGRAAHHAARLVVLHRHLTLAVGPEPAQLAALAHCRQLPAQGMGQREGGGHQLRGLVAGVAKHHALVARADLLVALAVHAHGDVAALLVDGGHDRTAAGVEAAGGVVVADFLHGPAHYLGDIHIAVGGDFAHDHDHACGGHSLAGYPAIGVLGQDRVQYSVGNLVADLVGMSFCNGLRGKNTVCHKLSVLSFVLMRRSKKAHPTVCLKWRNQSSSSFADRRNWHLAYAGCRGFIGPFPPPLLIRYSIVMKIVYPIGAGLSTGNSYYYQEIKS